MNLEAWICKGMYYELNVGWYLIPYDSNQPPFIGQSARCQKTSSTLLYCPILESKAHLPYQSNRIKP